MMRFHFSDIMIDPRFQLFDTAESTLTGNNFSSRENHDLRNSAARSVVLKQFRLLINVHDKKIGFATEFWTSSMLRHGPHHSAPNFTTTGFELSSTAFWNHASAGGGPLSGRSVITVTATTTNTIPDSRRFIFSMATDPPPLP
jgi:hypothetical protein